MSQKKLTIYDPAMCCTTGVCGPDIDPQLVRFSADLDWLAAHGVEVRRVGLAQEPGAFAEDAAVKAVLESKGEAGLPLIKVGNDIVSSGTYPSRDELSAWAGLTSAAQPMSAAKSSGCCGPTEAEATAPKKSSCC